VAIPEKYEKDQVFCKLTIDAGVSDIEIWIGDDKGNFVQKGVGFLETSLLPGKYTVEFGLGNPKHIVELTKDTVVRYDNRQTTGGVILTET
jgi:hypothetical protein